MGFHCLITTVEVQKLRKWSVSNFLVVFGIVHVKDGRWYWGMEMENLILALQPLYQLYFGYPHISALGWEGGPHHSVQLSSLSLCVWGGWSSLSPVTQHSLEATHTHTHTGTAGCNTRWESYISLTNLLMAHTQQHHIS